MSLIHIYDKLLLFLEEGEKKEALLKYRTQFFFCIDRLHGMYEIVQKDYSKATGI